MRIAIVVYCNGALSVPCGWGQPARGRETYGSALCACGVARGLREAALGLLGQRSGLFFFRSCCPSSVSKH